MTNEERFWAFVDKSAGPDACWPWAGGRDLKGYGNFWLHGRAVRATHRALEWSGRPRPALPGFHSAVAMHSCDNPACVNPAHLRWATQKENVHDGIAKGRHVRGEKNGGGAGRRGGRKGLCEARVAELKRRLLAGERQVSLAAEFGVTQAMVSLIATGRKWAHVKVITNSEPTSS